MDSIKRHLEFTRLLQQQQWVWWPIFPVILAAVLFRHAFGLSAKIPEMNSKLTDEKRLKEYNLNARGVVDAWFQKNPTTPAILHTEVAPFVVLPYFMADEIKNDDRFSMRQQVATLFNAHLPGFEVFRDDHNTALKVRIVTKHLNKHLSDLLEPLADETNLALPDIFTEPSEWHQIPLQGNVLQLITRVTSRALMGNKLCRDKEWLRVTAGYARIVISAFAELAKWPSFVQPIANRLLPKAKETRSYVDGVRKQLLPILEERRKEKQDALAQGKEPTVYHDTIEWAELEANGSKYDPAIVQLSLSLASIHQTTDLVSQVIADIASHPDIIKPLRDELDAVLPQGEWTRASLDKTSLLDSVIKESMRIKPGTTVFMGRRAMEQVTLSSGTVVPKGAYICVDAGGMWDPKFYDNPAEWDGYRFYKMQQVSEEKRRFSQLTASGPEHLGFGYGSYVCHGRFFAAYEVKIAVISILRKYDIKFEEGVTPKPIRHGIQMIFDPRTQLSIKLRQNS